MPIGVITNCLSVVTGGILGAAAGHRLSGRMKESLNMVFGACAMTMGISSITLMENMPAVIFSMILGTALGITLHFGERVAGLAGGLQKLMSRFIKRSGSALSQEEFDATFLTIIVLFCASGTGIYGAIVEGMSGDHSILISKSILDLFTALIFACSLGAVVSAIALPQFLVMMTLFLLGGFIFPYTTPSMVNDFKAVGGVVLLATGFRMLKLRMFPTADMIPTMILAMPVSWVWSSVIAPLLH